MLTVKSDKDYSSIVPSTRFMDVLVNGGRFGHFPPSLKCELLDKETN